MTDDATPRLERKTWRRKSGILSWSSIAPGCSQDLPRRWAAILEALGPFARPQATRCTTEADGEDAWVVPPDHEDLTDALGNVEGLTGLEARLDLKLREAGRHAIEPGAGFLWLTVADGADEPALELVLSVDLDIYAPCSWGTDRDNRRLARLNGPLLSGVLDRFAALGWRCREVDAPDYPGQVGPRGFVYSVSLESTELLGAVERYVDAFVAGHVQQAALDELEAAVADWRAAGAPPVKLPGGFDPSDGPRVAALLERVEHWLDGDEVVGAALERWADAQEAPAKAEADAARHTRLKTQARAGLRAALAGRGRGPAEGDGE